MTIKKDPVFCYCRKMCGWDRLVASIFYLKNILFSAPISAKFSRIIITIDIGSFSFRMMLTREHCRRITADQISNVHPHN